MKYRIKVSRDQGADYLPQSRETVGDLAVVAEIAATVVLCAGLAESESQAQWSRVYELGRRRSLTSVSWRSPRGFYFVVSREG